MREEAEQQHPSGARVERARIQSGAGSASSCLRDGDRWKQLCHDVGDGSLCAQGLDFPLEPFCLLSSTPCYVSAAAVASQ